MKTEPNESGAREEYFEQLLREICKYQTFDGAEETKYKERVLSISFDRVHELERRVEELEKALGIMTSLTRIKYGNLDKDVYEEILKAEKLLNPSK